MRALKSRLRATAVLPFVAGFGVAIAGPMLGSGPSSAEHATLNPVAVSQSQVAQARCMIPRLQSGAGGGVELTVAEASAAYDCIRPELRAAYEASGHTVAVNYQGFDRYSFAPYVAALHGGRYVNNYANSRGSSYGRYEDAGVMPSGAVLAKDSFDVSADGGVGVGPLFLMQKMPNGFNEASADWRYTMVLPDGSIYGETNGANSAGVQFCIDCHVVSSADQMFFLPVDFRVN